MFHIKNNYFTNVYLENRLVRLKQDVNSIKQRIDKYPNDFLKVKRANKTFNYRIVDRKTGKEKYIRKNMIEKAQVLAQRDYDYSYLKLAEKEIIDIEKLLAKNYQPRLQACYSNIHEGRKTLVNPLDMSDEDYINRWLSVPYSPKGFREDDTTEYYTEKGERVRSKSEIIIGDTLYKLKIPYKYECPLRLDQITIYPDFTILDVRERRVKFLEHFGMMGDPDYVKSMMAKINTYERNDIFLGDRLLCTFESSERSLNNNVLKSKLIQLLK